MGNDPNYKPSAFSDSDDSILDSNFSPDSSELIYSSSDSEWSGDDIFEIE